MLLTIVFFSASTGVIGWVLITGTGAWFTEVLFVVSLAFVVMGYLGLTRRGEVVLDTDAITAPPKSMLRREVVHLARADLTSVELRGRRKDRYLWLRAGDRKLVIAERGLPGGAEAFDALVAALDPGGLGTA